MTNENESSTGCGTALSSIFGVGMLIIGLLKSMDGCVGCLRAADSARDLGRAGRVIDDIPLHPRGFNPPNPSVAEQPNPYVIQNAESFIEAYPSFSKKSLKAIENGQGSNALLDIVNTYHEDMSALSIAFGKDSELAEDYHKQFIKNYKPEEAKNALLPKEFIDYSGGSELYGLYKGIHLNEEQAQILSRITRRSISTSSKRFDDYILLEEMGNQVIINTNFKRITATRNTFLKSIDINKSTRAVVRGKISDDLARLCASKGITYLSNSKKILRDLDISPQRFTFIYVASMDNAKLKTLFNLSNDAQIKDMLSIVKKLELDPDSRVVDNSLDVHFAQKEIRKSGDIPVLIFNNNKNKLFDKDPSKFKIEDYFTCKSYGISGVQSGHITTDFIYFEDFIKAIEKARSSDVSDAEEFWHQFSIEYNKNLKRRQAQLTTALVISGIGVGGGGFAIYYNNTKE